MQDIPKYKIDRLRALETDIQILLAEATRGQETGIYKTLNDVAKVSATTLAMRFNKQFGLVFNALSDKKIKQILSTDWSGKNWSARLWENNEIVGQKVKKIIENGMPQGYSMQKMARELKNATNQTYNNAFRLIRTEASYIDGQVTLEGYRRASEELGLN